MNDEPKQMQHFWTPSDEEINSVVAYLKNEKPQVWADLKALESAEEDINPVGRELLLASEKVINLGNRSAIAMILPLRKIALIELGKFKDV